MKIICMISLFGTAIGGSAIWTGTDSALVVMLTLLMAVVMVFTALVDA